MNRRQFLRRTVLAGIATVTGAGLVPASRPMVADALATVPKAYDIFFGDKYIGRAHGCIWILDEEWV